MLPNTKKRPNSGEPTKVVAVRLPVRIVERLEVCAIKADRFLGGFIADLLTNYALRRKLPK